MTWYDDASGDRTELSGTTLDNWVAKTANLLVDGAGLGAGDTVAVLLPPHWQTVVVTFAAWVAGCPLGDGGVAFVAEERLPVTGYADVVALSLRPMAARLAGTYPGVMDFAEEVPAYGDDFAPEAPLRQSPVPDARRVLLADADPVPAALAALAGGGGLVICRNADAAALGRRAETERAVVA